MSEDQKGAMETARKAVLMPSNAVHRRVAAELLREQAAGTLAGADMTHAQARRVAAKLRISAEALDNPT